MNLPVPCIVCGKELESAAGPVNDEGEETYNQPYGATAFTSHGHYGSTVFDPMTNAVFLEVNICDEDLRAAAASGRVLLGKSQRQKTPPPTYETFEPYEDEEELP